MIHLHRKGEALPVLLQKGAELEEGSLRGALKMPAFIGGPGQGPARRLKAKKGRRVGRVWDGAHSPSFEALWSAAISV